MEDEKKRKKNKKKKNKQTKSTDIVFSAVGEPASLSHNHVNGTEQNEQKLVSEAADVQDEGVQKPEVNLANGTDGATLEGKTKQLQKELDAHIHREADLETKVLLLQTEKSSWLQKEASYEKRINQLVEEAATSSSERVTIEEKLAQLEQEKVSWVKMDNTIKETIASLNDDNTRLRAQVLELEASRRDLVHQNQQLTENISGLQTQVQNLEIANAHLSTGSTMRAFENEQLEAARALVEKLLSENVQLVQKVNELYVELDGRGVTAGPSLSAGSDPIVGSAETAVVTDSSAHRTDPVIGSSETASITESSAFETCPMPLTGEGPASTAEYSAIGTDIMPATADTTDSVPVLGPMFEIIKRTLSVERLDSIEDDVIKPRNGGNYINDAEHEVITYSRESVESSEIVQIPLDENEVKVTELEAPQTDEKTDVPLTDAPLIGAPFRLISYFARYVSGADLVNKSSINSQR